MICQIDLKNNLYFNYKIMEKDWAVEKEDLRKANWCNLFKWCIEECRDCLFRTLEKDDDTPSRDEDWWYWSL